MGEIRGYNAPEVKDVYSRAQAVLDDSSALREQLFVMSGRFNVASVSAEHNVAREIAEQSLALASRYSEPKALALAHRIMGQAEWAEGRFIEARGHMEQCLAISRSSQLARDHSPAFVQNVIVPARGYLSCLFWLLGYPQQAETTGSNSLHKAREIGQPSRLAFALYSELLRYGLFEADPANALPLAKEIVTLCERNGVQLYPAWATFYYGVAAAQNGDPQHGIAIMRDVRQELQQNNIGLFGPIHLYHLAAAHARCGEFKVALALLDESIGIVEATQERMFEAELYRLRGELLLQTGRADQGEEELRTALAVARRQQARMWELRAAIALARHWDECGNTVGARDLLTPVYGWFSEGLDAPDLQWARSLLENLE
jgi:tetratricopeptide (TPR) repeat protein